jgi:hypothetical protein
VRYTINTLRADTSEEPAEQAVGAIKARFRERTFLRPAASLSPLAAILRFDSARHRPAFGVRASSSVERQLLYTAGPFEIDLRVVADGERWVLRGQLLSDQQGDSGHVELVGQGAALRVALSQACEFAFPPARAGRYSLTLSFAGQLIRVSDVLLGD